MRKAFDEWIGGQFPIELDAHSKTKYIVGVSSR